MSKRSALRAHKNEKHSSHDSLQPQLPLNLFVCVRKMCVFAGSRSVGSQLQSSSGCWLEVSVERSGQLWNHYHRHARGKIWTPCHLSTNHSFLIKLTCVCMLVLECVYTHVCMWACVCTCKAETEPWHVGRGKGMPLGMCVCAHVCGGNRWVKCPAQYFVSVYLFKSVVASKRTTAHVCVHW